MNRVFKFSTYLLLTWISFSLLTCAQTQFTGTPIKQDIADVLVKFNEGEFESVYSAGSPNFTMDPVSSKQTIATIKVRIGEKGLNVKVKDFKATPSRNNALEFVRKLRLKTGTNIIPILVYRENEKTGERFEIQINRQTSEGALRLIHLKCKYKNYAGEDIETDDFIDELPYHGIYQRSFANDKEVNLEVGSPELDTQRVEISGRKIEAVATSNDFKTYSIPLKSTEATFVDVTVYDSNKELEKSFRMSFCPLSKSQKESTDIDVIRMTTEDGDIFDFDKLDMAGLEPYTKGSINNSVVKIGNIYKLNTTLYTHANGTKPTLSIKTKEPGAKVELLARWNEVDHDQTSRQGLKMDNVEKGWNTKVLYDPVDFAPAGARGYLPVLRGHDTDMEFKFCPYQQGKFDLLFRVTSPDKTKQKYYEVKYGFVFLYAYFYVMEPFQAIVQRKSNSLEAQPVIVKASDEEGLYNVYLPSDTKSVRFIADDRYDVNVATGYKKNYGEIWNFRYYLSVDDGDYSRTHPSNTDRNYKEIIIDSPTGQEEHKFSIVSYQNGELKNGTFVDEYGNEDNVDKVQRDFRFRFIKEDRRIAPALSVLKVEGTPTPNSVPSAINGKIWPTFSFRPAVSENKIALPNNVPTYKLKMLKTDSSSKIYVDGQEVTATETFTQKLQNVSEKFPEFITAGIDNTVDFYTYELTPAKYYEGGKLKSGTISISVVKDGLYREYQLEIVAVDPDNNDTKITVLDSNGGSARVGTRVLYKEHKANEELKLQPDGKLYTGAFSELGTTGSDGILSCRGKLKAGRYYDIYALGDDVETADSMIEHYYVTGMPDEIIDLMQLSLTQNGGADYEDKDGNKHRIKPIRGSCPVRLKKQLKKKTNPSDPDEYHNGAYFFFRQQTLGGGGLFGGSSGTWQLKPCNLTCGDAHIKMADADAGALTDMVTWFDVNQGNSIEPVSWGPNGVMIAFENTPFAYSFNINMTDYNPNGQISMNAEATMTLSSNRWDFPSGVYDLVLVAYDVAGNRLERHQLVSIEAANMMKGQNPGVDGDKDSRKVKFENFKVSLFRWPTKMNVFENKQYFENLFGMPWTEYTPPKGQGDKIRTPSTYIALARGYIGDDNGAIGVSGVDLYRRCVEDDTPFKRVGSTIPPFRGSAFAAMDTDFTLEEGKTYQYKMIAFVDEGSSLETEYLGEVKVPPSFMYFLDSIKVRGQAGGVKDNTVYTYNANKMDKNIPCLKAKKYPRNTPEKDRTRLKIDYSARMSNPKLWSKEYASEIEFGITLYTRDNQPVFASKCILVFDDGDEELYVYLPNSGNYVSLEQLIKMKIVPSRYSIDDLMTFNKSTGQLTIKDAYLRIKPFNWAQLYGGDGSFNYEAGNTYYWDVVSWSSYPIGGAVSAMSIVKSFDAKKKEAPSEKYRDDDGDTKAGGIYMIFGNGESDGGNSVNGRCRFTVVEED
ncbi:MAG: hypothetical protein ACTTIZ_05685 [Treponema sp.]